MATKPFRVWITKYALTSGVIAFTVDNYEDDGIIEILSGRYAMTFCHHEGRDWHRDRESALARVEAMRTAAIKSARKRLDKLTTMRVEVPR